MLIETTLIQIASIANSDRNVAANYRYLKEILEIVIYIYSQVKNE